MKKSFKERLLAIKPSKRRLIQLYAALLANANLKGYINGKIYTGDLKGICTPGLNCYSCPGASGACPLGSLQNALSSANKSFPYYIFGILMLYGIMLGRWICGFLCPFGLIQDILHKIKTPKLKKNKFTKILSYFKYVILVLFVFIIPLVYMLKDFPLPGFCKYICPAGTLGGAIGLLINPENSEMFGMLGPLFTWKFALLCSFIVGAVFIYRVFCRFICPLGAIYGLFNRFAILGIKLEKPKCTDCGLCVSKCKMDISHVGDHECIMCGECISVCPTKAISWSGSKIILPENEIEAVNADSALSESEREAKLAAVEARRAKRIKVLKIVASAIMIATLASALVYYNFIDKAPGESSGETPGDPSGDVEGPSYNPAESGKVTIVNFWYTTCGPCVQELPHFNELASEYGNSIDVVAIHRYDDDLLDGDALAYVESNFQGSEMIFLADKDGDAYYYALDGSAAWPMTVVVDQNGVIMAKKIGKMSKEELKSAIDLSLSMPEYDTSSLTVGTAIGNLLPGAKLEYIDPAKAE